MLYKSDLVDAPMLFGALRRPGEGMQAWVSACAEGSIDFHGYRLSHRWSGLCSVLRQKDSGNRRAGFRRADTVRKERLT